MVTVHWTVQRTAFTLGVKPRGSRPVCSIEDTEQFSITGTFTLSEFSETVGELGLFPESEPGQDIFHNYRRWAFESAALDLALKQDGTNLATALSREYDPVRFVVSTRLGDPATTDRVEQWLDINPELEFKLDPTSDWTISLVDDLAETDAVTDEIPPYSKATKRA